MRAAAIRPGRLEDLSALLAIYNHYVEHSDATFDVRPATMDERELWMSTFAATGSHQLLVADDGRGTLGYVASSPYRTVSWVLPVIATPSASDTAKIVNRRAGRPGWDWRRTS